MPGTLISVIVPTFNRAYCLGRTLESALRQTYPNVEILVVDDGSSDDTAVLIARDYRDEKRVRYLYQENRGVSAARNLGLRHARGEFVAFLDSDDIWEPWKLELQVAAMRFAPEVVMVWTDMSAVRPDGTLISETYLKTMYQAYKYFTTRDLFPKVYSLGEISSDYSNKLGHAAFHVGEIFSQMIMGNMVHTSTVLVSRRVIDAIQGFNEELTISGEDYDFHLRTCREGPVGFINLPTVRYLVGQEDQLTHASCNIHIARNFLRTIEPIIQGERNRIKLPDHMLSTVLAYAHEWIGWELFLNGSNREAARHYLHSLSQKPFNPKPFVLLALAAMPKRFSHSLLSAYRKLRSQASRA